MVDQTQNFDPSRTPCLTTGREYRFQTVPGRGPWLEMWNGSSGAAAYQELVILTHTDDSGTPTVFTVNLQETLKTVATAVDAAAKLADMSAPAWVAELTEEKPDDATGGVKDSP